MIFLCSGAKVRVVCRDSEEATILGIEQQGYLRVESTSGQEISLDPYWNSFDIKRGLVIKT